MRRETLRETYDRSKAEGQILADQGVSRPARFAIGAGRAVAINIVPLTLKFVVTILRIGFSAFRR